MKFLLYKWQVYNQEDVKTAIEYFGHTVDMYEEKCLSKNEVTGERIYDLPELERVIGEYEVVITLNYYGHISDICESLGKKYIAWTVDSPLITLYHRSVYNSCNYIFIFDKYYYYQMKGLGLKNVFYLPLAVNTNRLDKVIENQTPEEIEEYTCDVSFVGSLYHRNSYDGIYDSLTPYLRGYCDAAIMAQLDLFGMNIFDDMLTVDIMAKLMEIVDFKMDEGAFSDLQLVFASTFLGFKLANVERVRNLNEIGKAFGDDYNISLYSDDYEPMNKGVNHRGVLDYMTDMPRLFHDSKINLNFTIRNIRTGLPLRLWDVLGAGGFLITNFQEELLEYFENDKDIVFYDSKDDLLRKIDYYLTHEDHRCTVASAGYQKVKQYHSYENRIQKILDSIT